jgi:hypothetical protein
MNKPSISASNKGSLFGFQVCLSFFTQSWFSITARLNCQNSLVCRYLLDKSEIISSARSAQNGKYLSGSLDVVFEASLSRTSSETMKAAGVTSGVPAWTTELTAK